MSRYELRYRARWGAWVKRSSPRSPKSRTCCRWAARTTLPRETRSPFPERPARFPLSTSLADVIADADVVVDFTNGEGAADAIDIVPASGKHLVIGSTGIPDERHRASREARRRAQRRHLHRPQLHHRRGRDDAPREGGRAVLRLRRSPRDPS